MLFSLEGSVLFHEKLYSKEKLRSMEAWVNKKIGDISKDKPVALAMQRTPLLMVTLFALLKRGITFLPVDPSFPTERLQYMLKKQR